MSRFAFKIEDFEFTKEEKQNPIQKIIESLDLEESPDLVIKANFNPSAADKLSALRPCQSSC